MRRTELIKKFMKEFNLTGSELKEKLVSGSGVLVKTSKGLRGRTYNSDDLVNGKVLVYTDDGSKLLCDPKKLEVIGFID